MVSCVACPLGTNTSGEGADSVANCTADEAPPPGGGGRRRALLREALLAAADSDLAEASAHGRVDARVEVDMGIEAVMAGCLAIGLLGLIARAAAARVRGVTGQ